MQTATHVAPQRAKSLPRVMIAAVIAVAFALLGMQTASPASAAVIPNAITGVSVAESIAHKGGRVQVDFTFEFATASKGDTFSLTMPDILKPGLRSFNMLYPGTDELFAVATIAGQTVTFTLTDYVTGKSDFSGSGYVFTSFHTDEDPGTSTELEFISDGTIFPGGNIEVGEAPDIDRDDSAKSGEWGVDTDGNEIIKWMVASARGPFGHVTITDPVSEFNQKMKCESLIVYNTFDWDRNGSSLGNPTPIPNDGSRYIQTCDENGFKIEMTTNIEVDEIIVLTFDALLTDASLDSYKNSATFVTAAGDQSTGTGTVVRNEGGGGTGGGTALGEVNVFKRVVDNLPPGSTIVIPAEFEVRLSCLTPAGTTVAGFPKEFKINATTGSTAGSTQKVPVGSKCTILELGEYADFAEYSAEVTVGSTPVDLTVTNTFVDDPADPKLTIAKKLAGEVPASVTSDSEFDVTLACALGGGNAQGFPKELKISESTSATISVPSGAECTITEMDVAAGVTAAYDPAGGALGVVTEDQTVTVTNTYKPTDPVTPKDPTAPTPPGLATTGAGSDFGLMVGASAAILLGLGALTALRTRKRSNAG